MYGTYHKVMGYTAWTEHALIYLWNNKGVEAEQHHTGLSHKFNFKSQLHIINTRLTDLLQDIASDLDCCREELVDLTRDESDAFYHCCYLNTPLDLVRRYNNIKGRGMLTM